MNEGQHFDGASNTGAFFFEYEVLLIRVVVLQSTKNSLEGRYSLKTMKDSSLGNSPVALLLSESPRTTGSMIPTTPTYDNQEQKLSNTASRGNWNSKLASSRSTGATSTWSKGFDGVVTTEEEGNGYGWKQSDLSVKQGRLVVSFSLLVAAFL